MDVSIHVTGLDADGIKLIPPERLEFDDLARPLLGRIADTTKITKEGLCKKELFVSFVSFVVP